MPRRRPACSASPPPRPPTCASPCRPTPPPASRRSWSPIEGRLWKLVRTFDDPATWTEPGVRQLAASGADGDRYRDQPLADEWELYDLTGDPIEAVNRGASATDDLRSRLTERLAVERAATGPARHDPWPYVTGEPSEWVREHRRIRRRRARRPHRRGDRQHRLLRRRPHRSGRSRSCSSVPPDWPIGAGRSR